MPVNPTKILLWAQIGQQLFQIAETEYSHLQAALSANGIVADTAQLQQIQALYDARIARREANGGSTGE